MCDRFWWSIVSRVMGHESRNLGLRLDSRDGLMAGGDTGPSIHVGQPDESLLIQAVRGMGDISMPPDEPLDAHDVDQLVEWIRRGAPWPEEQTVITVRGGPITDAERNFWSFQPVRDPEPPQLDHDDWSTSEIDRFLFATLDSSGLQPAPTADRRTWLRRATFDLTGLPPTPEEVAAFSE